LTPIGRPSVAEMRIMRPHNNFASAKATIKVPREGLKRFRHMAVPQIPSVHTAMEHPAVVFFGVLDQPGVLFRREEVILCRLTVPMKVIIGAALQIFKLLQDLVLARV